MKGRRRTSSVLAACLAFLFAAVPLAFAQTTGSVLGTVKDQTGGVLPGATVTVKNVDTGVTREVTTETDGRYRVTALNIGAYDVSANLQGFQPVVRTGIVLTIGRDAVVDFSLSLGSMTESVEVSATRVKVSLHTQFVRPK